MTIMGYQAKKLHRLAGVGALGSVADEAQGGHHGGG